MDYDDFPISPEHWADAATYYAAFLRAQEFVKAVHAKARGSNPKRLLSEVTSELYRSREQPATLLRAAPGAEAAGAAVWLTRVRTLAHWFAAHVPVPTFHGIDRSVLVQFARLSADIKQLPTVAERLLQYGIVLVHERAIPGAKVDGAVFKLANGTPVIGISLRYPRLDHYWFTLLHELSHIVLHADLLDAPIIDDLDEEGPELIERQANHQASNAFMSSAEWRSCPARYSLKEDDVIAFAAKLGVAPQIVAGRIRRDRGRHDLFAGLINYVNVREVLLGED